MTAKARRPIASLKPRVSEMAGRAALVTDANIKRVIKAARAAGLPIHRVRVSRDTVEIVTAGDSEPVQATGWEDIGKPANGEDQTAVRPRVRARR